MSARQASLFDTAPPGPEGFRYRDELISADEEARLVERFAALPFKAFEFRGYEGLRRTVSYGWRYDFNAARLTRSKDVPGFLAPLREKAAAFAGLAPVDFAHALVTEYAPGAPIGWHRDRPQFGQVVGVSFLSPCLFRFRRKAGDRWERISTPLEPRSAYLLSGPARDAWEHSITAAERLRYSVTFRTLREPPQKL